MHHSDSDLKSSSLDDDDDEDDSGLYSILRMREKSEENEHSI